MNKIELCDTINPSLVSVKPKTVQPAPVAKKLNLDTRTINMYAQLFSALQQHFQFCDFSAGNYILRQSLLKIADMDNAYLRLYSDNGARYLIPMAWIPNVFMSSDYCKDDCIAVQYVDTTFLNRLLGMLPCDERNRFTFGGFTSVILPVTILGNVGSTVCPQKHPERFAMNWYPPMEDSIRFMTTLANCDVKVLDT